MPTVQRVALQQVPAEGEVPSLGQLDLDVPPLGRWLDAWTTLHDRDARDNVRDALTHWPATAAHAQALVELLESGRLKGVRLASGLSAREAVVETLLKMDVHALNVPPEELDWLRALQRKRRIRFHLAWSLSALAVALWTSVLVSF